VQKFWLFCLTLAVLGLSIVLPPSADARISPCPSRPPQLRTTLECQIAIADLHPTQPVVGKYQVQYQVAVLNVIDRGESSEYATVEDYVNQRKVPVVLGPGNQFYMVDSHHTMSSIWEYYQGNPNIRVNIEIIQDWRNKPDFWSAMKANNYTYLGTPGNTISPEDLPRNLGELKNDPYRAAVGMALNWGFFERPKGEKIFFYQFKLADCLKEFGLTLPEEINRSHIYQTLAMIHDPEYSYGNSSVCNIPRPQELSLEGIAKKLQR